MKEKDSKTAEDILAQLSNTKTSEAVLKSVYCKLNSNIFSNVQRVKLLKIITLHCTKEGYSSDLRTEALGVGLNLVKADLPLSSHPVGGATFSFLEVCCEIVNDFTAGFSHIHVELVGKALQILTNVNAATASKLFSDKVCPALIQTLSSCLKIKELKCYALTLLEVCLKFPEPTKISKAIMEERTLFIQLVYPLIFDTEDAMRGPALQVIEKLNVKCKPQLFWVQLKEDTQKIYCKRMVEMVNEKQNWPEIWQFAVNMFGDELHSGGQLINHMLEVLERAFKHSDYEWTRVQAFVCWETLIDNFRSGLRNKKRIDLIMIPLKANNHRNESLAKAKLQTYDHLLKALGKDLILFPDILLHFFSFCFGSERMSCPPVKSYPALHESTASIIRSVLVSPHIGEIFVKVHKELFNAIGDCFLMQNAPLEVLQQLWSRILELLQKVEGTDVVKMLFTTIDRLIAQTAEDSDSESSLNSLPSPQSPDIIIGKRLVSIILNEMVRGSYALKKSLFNSRSLYIGTYDVMTGTPALLIIEWLLTPTLMLSAGELPEYRLLVAAMISLRREDLGGFMDFSLFVLKRMLFVEESLPLSKKTLFYGHATHIWCTLVQEMIEYLRNEGSINQGDAAEHDFGALYSVLLFPTQNLSLKFELIEECSEQWSSLFYESCQQAALVPTASFQHLCEQVCSQLIGLNKPSGNSKQRASVYLFLRCILQVASGRFQSVKRLRWVQLHISGILKDLNFWLVDEDCVFIQAIACVEHCLIISTISLDVASNVSTTICSLLRAKVVSSYLIDKLCSLLNTVKEVCVVLYQHGSAKEAISKGFLKSIIEVGRNHTSPNVRSSIKELDNAPLEKKTPEKETKSLHFVNSTALSPSNRSPKPEACVSPKSIPKKFSAIQMTPSNLSPRNSKRKLQSSGIGADGTFVRIETPPKKIILTEHQKEVRRERRQDIPALYQDLSQDTQSMSQDASQDCVPLPLTPNGKSGVPVDEDAVMDVVDVGSSVQILSMKLISPKSAKKEQSFVEPKKETRSFTPPAGFILPSTANSRSESKHAHTTNIVDSNCDARHGKENEKAPSPSLSNKPSKASCRGAITRSSSSTLLTRSGKVVKRNSLAQEPKAKKKSIRKSLPLVSSEEPSKKCVIEANVNDSDTESASSVTSDNNVVGSIPAISSPKTRKKSFKPTNPINAASEVASAKEDKISEMECITIPSNINESTLNDKLPKSDCNQQTTDWNLKQSSQKGISGKVLTRSSSNSSLDDVKFINKPKESTCPDFPEKSLSLKADSIPKGSVSSPVKMSHDSPRKDLALPKEVHCVAEERQSASCEFSPTLKTLNGSVPDKAMFPILNPTEQQLSSIVNQSQLRSIDTMATSSNSEDHLLSHPQENDCTEKQHGTPGNFSHQPHEISLETSPRIGDKEVIRGSEESQEIIESSQDTLSKLVKPCLVSLEKFKCADVNKKTFIEDVIVEKGPDANSPYKVHSRDMQVAANTPSLARRSLNMDSDKESCVSNISLVLTSTMDTTSILANKTSPKKKNKDSFESDDTQRKDSDSSENDAKEASRTNEKEQNSASTNDLETRNDAQPEWMHEKKSSPMNKAMRTIRGASARSQAFMKSVTDVELFSSSPPKAIDASPITSPVHVKKTSRTDCGNSTPIIKRSSRAAQLLGLGQAAAARGGDTVVSNTTRPARGEKASEVDENESVTSSCIAGIASPTVTISSNTINHSANFTLNSTNEFANTVVSSPSVRRQTRLMDLGTVKLTPQKNLEDEGLKEDWVRKTPCSTATPDSSILKRKRDADSDAPSPNIKRKRVSFRDPPLSSLLRYEKSESTVGTVFSSDCSDGPERAVVSPNLSAEAEDDFSMSVTAVCGKENDKETKEGHHTDGLVQETVSQTNKLSDRDAEKQNVDYPAGNNIPYKTDSKKEKNIEDGGSCKTSKSLHHSPEKQIQRNSHSPICETPDLGNHVEKMLVRNEKSCTADNVNPGSHQNLSCSLVVENNINDIINGHDNSPEEADTQGMLDNLFRVPSLSSPVYPNLVTCVHPISLIALKLTSPVWKKSLLKELAHKGISFVGDLAKLSEDQIDRLSVKPPKRTNVYVVLEEFEKCHSSLKDGLICDLPKLNLKDDVIVEEPPNKLMDALSNATDEDIILTLSQLKRESAFFQKVIKSQPLQDIITTVSSDHQILKSLPLDVLINSKEPKEVAAIVSSNQNILQSLPVDVVLTSKQPQAVAASIIFNQEVMKFLPIDLVLNSKEREDVVAAVISNEKIVSLLPMKAVINRKKPEEVAAAVSSSPEILECLPVESVLNSKQPQDVAAAINTNDKILSYLSVRAVVKSRKPIEVAAVIGSKPQILKALPKKAVAETYFSQVSSSSGEREKSITVEELSSMLNLIPSEVMKDTMYPSIPNKISSVFLDDMRNYTLRECSASDIVKNLDQNQACEMLESFMTKVGLELCASKLLPKLQPVEITQHVDSHKNEEIINALLNTLDPKVCLSFLLDKMQNIVNKCKIVV